MLGAIAARERAYGEAESLLKRAVALNRRSPYFRHSLGNVHRERGDFNAAANAYRDALRLDPRLAPAYLGLAVAERGLGRTQEAVANARQYVARVPGDAEGHAVLGASLHDLGELQQALEHFRMSLRIDPGHASARHGIARVLLLMEQFDEGWPAWLLSVANLALPGSENAKALFESKRVDVYGTEGVGDEIMFASCVPDLASLAAEVTLHCDPRLVPLFRRSFPAVHTSGMVKEGARRTIGIVGPDETHVLASFLPAHFRSGAGRFAGRVPYLEPDPVAVAEWRRRFAALGPGLKVGLSWRGGVEPANRARRSIALAELVDVLKVAGVHFVNLQHGDVAAEVDRFRQREHVPLHGWTDANPLIDLDFVAAEVAALDLVITVDNTTAHLAGALGRPVWVLLSRVPDWRWTMSGEASSWYRSARLLRQREDGQWGAVVAEVATSLRAMAAACRAEANGT